MNNFIQHRETVQQLRGKQRGLRDHHYKLQQRLYIILDQLEGATPTTMAPLIQEQARLGQEIQDAMHMLQQVEVELSAAVHAFHDEGIPQDLVEHLDDGIPFLLMPIRVETRFMIIKHVARKIDRSLYLMSRILRLDLLLPLSLKAPKAPTFHS
ncbi:MAG: hypothetical protein GKS05_12250 [Nitrospirales bacterium]|nr:hypothetical protein [Nitrospirales bacterium]